VTIIVTRMFLMLDRNWLLLGYGLPPEKWSSLK
jgi:hypothetical protein